MPLSNPATLRARAERTGGRSKHRLESQCILKITEKRLLARMLGNPDCGFCRGCRRCAGLQRFLWLRFCRFRNRLQIIILKITSIGTKKPPLCLGGGLLNVWLI